MPRGGKRPNSGRKSEYQERHDAEALWALWNNIRDKEGVRKMLSSGKYSLKDVFVSKAFGGNERILIEIFKKLYPDLVDVAMGGRIPLDEEGKKVIKKLKKHEKSNVKGSRKPKKSEPK